MPEQEEQSRTDRAAHDYGVFLRELARPGAFPSPLAVSEPIPTLQTHASAVLLADAYAYKLKKPKDFGFFDYSTPALRRHFCQEEVRLNARLAPEVYRGIAPVMIAADGRARFGPTLPPDQVPEPEALFDGGKVVDYAVVMARLPDEAALSVQVRGGTVTPRLLAEVAERVAAFHASVPTTEHIMAFGDLAVIRGNWEENFAQTRPFVGQVLDAATLPSSRLRCGAFCASASRCLRSASAAGASATVTEICACSMCMCWGSMRMPAIVWR